MKEKITMLEATSAPVDGRDGRDRRGHAIFLSESKGLNGLPNFKGEFSKFPAWARKVKTNVIQIYPETDEMFKRIETHGDIITNSDFGDRCLLENSDAMKISCQLQTFLENKCEDAPLGEVNNSGTGKGFEAW